MTRRMQSLLGQSGGAPQEPQEGHPDGSWRADALGKSRHARLTEHVREPLDDCDSEKARRLCAEVSRHLLADFAPALLWVAPAERLRCQVLATWVRTLFDFARQTGVEGERLAALNRLEFTLEQSLEGPVVGQPVFVAMALEEGRRAWSRPALDALMAAARRRIVRPRLSTAAEVEADSKQLATAICGALLPSEPADSIVTLAAALLRLRSLVDLGEAMRRDQAALPVAELPSKGDVEGPVGSERLDAAVRSELGRIRPVLTDTTALRAAPGEYRAGLRYLRVAGCALANRIDRCGSQVATAPPRLGLGARLGILLRSRFPG